MSFGGFFSVCCRMVWLTVFVRIRFAPPLVITEEDMDKAIKIIGQCLNDLDKVCVCIFYMSFLCLRCVVV